MAIPGRHRPDQDDQGDAPVGGPPPAAPPGRIQETPHGPEKSGVAPDRGHRTGPPRRSYAAAGSLVIEFEDDLCPWNTGRWKLDTSGDNAFVESTDAEADLRIGPSELGSVYLGGNTFGELLRAGFLDELQPGAAWRADGMFRTERKPWCPEIF